MTSSGSPLLAFHSSPESYHSGAAVADHVNDPVRQLPPLRFCPLRRFPDNGQLHTPEGYQPSGYDAFSAFHTLSRLSSTRCLPAIFHAGPALGVSPSGSILTPGAIHSLELLSPLVVSSPYGLCFRCLDPRPLGYGRFPRDDPSRSNASFSSPHSRVFVPVSARPSGANFARKNATLLGFHLPKGFPLSPAGLPRSPFLS